MESIEEIDPLPELPQATESEINALLGNLLFSPGDIAAYNVVIDWYLDHGEEGLAKAWMISRDNETHAQMFNALLVTAATGGTYSGMSVPLNTFLRSLGIATGKSSI